MRRTIIAVYDDIGIAEDVVEDLVQAGVDRSNIGFALHDPGSRGEKVEGTLTDDHIKVGEGAGFGAVVGGLTGLLIGLGALVIPGVGPILAAGPIASALGGTAVGAAAGAITGGLVGALTGLGVPEEEAGMYAEAVRRGGGLVTTTVHDDMIDKAVEIMHRHGPVDLESRVSQWRATGWERFDPNIDPFTAEELAKERQSNRLGTEARDYMPHSYDYEVD